MSRVFLFMLLMVAPFAEGTSGPGYAPPPPLGWEDRITKGFEPPIEYVIAIESGTTNKAMQKYLDSWGDDAVPVLKRLAEEPFWQDYRGKIQKFLQVGNVEPDWDALEKRLLKLVVESDRGETQEPYEILFSFGRGPEARALEVLEKAGANASPRFLSAVSAAIASVASPARKEALERLQKARADSPELGSIRYDLEDISGRIRAQQPMKAPADE